MAKDKDASLVLFGRDLPQGVVVMWHGSARDIPKGWKVCDGTEGTPDMCTPSAQIGLLYIKRVK